MRLLMPVLLALAMASPALAQARTETVTFVVDGQRVVGTLVIPDGPPAPVVVLFHGFGGSRDELPIPRAGGEGIYTRAARLWADQGLASLRIDFRGSGESDGEFEDTTYSAQIGDGIAAVKFLEADPRMDATRLGLLGWSQGGMVASAVAARTGAPDAVALWAALGEPLPTFEKLFGADRIAAGLKTGDVPLELPMPWGFSLYMKQPYFEELATTHPLEEIMAYPGPLFVAQGTRDEVIPAGTAEKFIAAHEGPEELWIRPMDHGFNSQSELATLDELIAATGAFFEHYL